MEVNWIISNRKYRIVYKHYTKRKQPTSHSAQPRMADPGLSQSTIGSAYPPSSRPAARSDGSGGRKIKTLGIKIQFSTKRPKKVKRSGFVHWMNDTVKSMAPSWMKKYFKKKGAIAEEGAVPGTDQNCQSPPPPCPYCSEVGPLRLDGCDSPEPSTSSTVPAYSDVPTSKMVSLRKLSSREMDKANSRPQPSRSSRNNPASNLSLFGTYSTLDRTALNSSQNGDSPFYPGKTSYGGRAASRSPHRRAETPCQSLVRRPITAKPARAQPCGVKSNAARRILQSLESMSSPVAVSLHTHG
ncbi:uncharacterized protein LOC128448219 [Pleuronectes platessa]|uniref:uncharacterized protein LOC128448219 n=1 Tax=Pleuronectes platessa TaxID=8262 RepID=UPI00232A5441|nr:uncharacterized protein LOC128448219 [Pleuronectes platessa]